MEVGSGVQWGAGRQQGQGGTFQGLPGRREGAAACRMAQGSGKGEGGGRKVPTPLQTLMGLGVCGEGGVP